MNANRNDPEKEDAGSTAFKLPEKRGNAPVPLSILDFAMVGKGVSAITGMEKSIELAKLADRTHQTYLNNLLSYS